MLRRLVTVPAVAAIALSLGVAASAASEPAKPKDFTVKVVAVTPGGSAAVADAAAEGTVPGGGPYFSARANVIAVPRGTYVIAADIYTLAPDDQAVSQTMTAVTRTVTRDMTVTLSTAGGQLASASLGVAGATAQSWDATICGPMSDGAGPDYYPMVFSPATGIPVYVVPNSSKDLRFSYVVDFAAGGTQYYVNGQSRGLPASPHYSFRQSQLARLTLQARTGTYVNSGLAALEVDPAGSCNDYGYQSQLSLPGTQDDYVTAGRWLTLELPYGAPGGEPPQIYADYSAGHDYTQVFGAAVYGPGTWQGLPYLSRHELHVLVDPFVDPYTSTPAEGAAVVASTLSGPGVRDRAVRGDQAKLSRIGWYTVAVTARPAPAPAGTTGPVLSTKVTLAWHFDVTSLSAASRMLPVSLASFFPAGLDLSNDAAPGGTTTVRIVIDKAAAVGGVASAAPQYRIRAVAVEASSDGGKTWQRLAATERDGYWVVRVADPASGYVSLRSTVTDAHGDSTVETVYRAYGIS